MIFHHSLALSCTPTSWQSTTGCVIPKPGKPDYTNPKAFRIISLTSCFQKLLERLVLWYLEQDLKIPAKLTKSQHGFRKGKSTESAIHILTRKIEDAVATGNYALGIFLDIEQAFDAISFQAIKDALIQAGIPETITNWIYHMVSNRMITVTYCGHDTTKKATKGSPQGGVLSPLLWNITLDTLLSSLGIHTSFVQAFADDLVILISGICKTTVQEISQRHLTNINRWCASKGLNLSALKSKAILFTNKRDNMLTNPLMVGNNQVPQVTDTMYLGVTIDSKLSWGMHIQAKCTKAVQHLQACNRAVGKTWGISPSGTRWIYNQIILPSLGYAALAWQHRLDEAHYIKTKMQAIQRHASIMISRGLKSTPLENLEIMAGIKPIDLKLKELAILSARRLKINGNWNSNYQFSRTGNCKSHAYHLDKVMSAIPAMKCKITDIIKTTTVLDRKFKTILQDRSKATQQVGLTPTTHWAIFTDGSKIGKFSGVGYCVIRNSFEVHRQSFHLGTNATVYQCELFALNTSAHWATNTISEPGTITFFSDSQAAILAVTHLLVTSNLVLDTINLLNKLGQTHTVNVRWVPGHAGIPGNERADELAREGSLTIALGPDS